MDLKKLRITEKRIELLNHMNILCAEDLLSYYPIRYEIMEVVPFLKWEKGDKVSFEGVIVSPARAMRLAYKRTLTKFKVLYEEEEIEVTIFNRPWVSNFKVGSTITIIGKYDGYRKVTAASYNMKPIKEQVGIIPVYPLKDGIHQKDIHNYVQKALVAMEDEIYDFIPETYRKKYRLIDRKAALYGIHTPQTKEQLKQSLRHLKYEEFLRFQLVMQMYKKMETKEVQGHAKCFDVKDVYALQRALAFELTNAQKETIEDILKDLQSNKVMYRMLQGDVGCGKTLVAAFGMYACVLSHKQACMMAPTEILAKQHYQNLKELFKDFDLNVEVLYSSLKTQKKKEVLERLKKNEIDILIGTHALFQEDVQFYDLGFVVADEQHRFGVEQRKRLLEKGEKVDFLLMSATPIPRTLAISLYGDMDVSTIHELPKGRMPITTKLVQSTSLASVLDEILAYIDEGNQCYVVCPAIEKNEEMPMRNVQEIYEGMNSTLGRKYKIALLHGKMSAEEKETIMQQFVNKEIDILVSTTVIEVGVDVKDANIMVIYDAHRFGLSQIHQLRGRVGRGNKPGYCYLLSATKEEESLKRLRACTKTLDGFEISKYDLAMRGPGDILGVRQSGVPGFILGDVIADANILEVARKDASEILAHIEEEENRMVQAFIEEQMRKTSYVD